MRACAASSAACSPAPGARHERRVKGAAHVELDRALGPLRLGDLHRACRRRPRRRRSRAAPACCSSRARRPRRSPPTASAHAASTAASSRPITAAIAPRGPHAALGHQLAAAPHELQRLLEAEGPRRVVRGELAERVAGGGAHARPEPVAHDRPDRGAVRQERRLRVLRRGELGLRALEAERRLSGAPSARSAASNTARAAGCAAARSFPIPGFWDPCPGKSSTMSTSRRRG